MEKQLLLRKMLVELNDLPVAYLKHWYELIHTFRVSLPVKELSDSRAFDWDSLLDEVAKNRQLNNQKLVETMSKLPND